jgi:hypothetical protein
MLENRCVFNPLLKTGNEVEVRPEIGSWFHRFGAWKENALSAADFRVRVRILGTSKRVVSVAERRPSRDGVSNVKQDVR